MNGSNAFVGDASPPVDLRATIIRNSIVINRRLEGRTHPPILYIGDLSFLGRLLFHYSVPSLWRGLGAGRMKVFWVTGP